MNNTMAVDSIYEAAWLMCNNIPLRDHQRRFGYSTFFFDDDKKTIALLEEYKQNTTFELFERSIRRIKSLMYSDRLNESQNNTTNYVKQSGYTVR